MSIRSVLLGVGLCFASVQLDAQVLEIPSNTLDGVYTQSLDNPNRKPVPYVKLYERDIMWARRVWRLVDMNEKQNQVFYFPEKPAQGRVNLWTGIFNAILNKGTITAYSVGSLGDNDMFNEPILSSEVEQLMIKKCEIPGFDPITGDPITNEVYDTLTFDKIKKFAIKEEVFFDKQRSVLEYRILGLAPIAPYLDGQCNVLGERELFWVYFPAIRSELVNLEVYNVKNDVQRLTYDDIFWKRAFVGRATKQTNVYDRRLDMYLSPMDQLLESERIKQDIFNFEHDLWSF